MIREEKLIPLIRWAGGKTHELKYIHPRMPKKFDRFFEPFLGGGALYFSINENTKKVVNDFSYELVLLYKMVKSQDLEFLDSIKEISHNWDLLSEISKNHRKNVISMYKDFSNDRLSDQQLKDWINVFVLKNSIEFSGMLNVSFNTNIKNFIKEIEKSLFNKIKRMKKIESERETLPANDIIDNFEGALKSALYVHFRYLYNNIDKYVFNKSFSTALFFFIRNYAYSGMFRYNNSGVFNVPYGGIAYNKKSLLQKYDYFKQTSLKKHLKNTKIENKDFEVFLKDNEPTKEDFIFLDPPYDSEFSTYAKNKFGREDQSRLADYLINECPAKWMIIIKNTDFIFSLYNDKGLNLSSFDKKYLVSFQNRNDKDVVHLMITNY
ncbi:DNA adenine methylase [Hyphomicrobiales bacterium]|nr:DNA adenine methylase [Hyphomicrobiales bacterium]